MTGTVKLRTVVKRFGKVEAVRDVSFELLEGETVALVGHNGAGKTTLFKLMLGLIRPTGGTIRCWATIRPRASSRRAAGSATCRRTSRSTRPDRARDAAFYARLKQRADAQVVARCSSASASAHAADRRVGTYSKGMRQRLGLAQALLGEPQVLLLDEPTTGLDPALRQSFYEIVEELRARGATVLLSSHVLTEFEERAGRVVIMNRGSRSPTARSTSCAASPGCRPASA